MYTIKTHGIIRQIIVVLQRFGMWKSEYETIYWKMGKKIIHLIISVLFTSSLVLGAVLCDDKNETIFLLAAAIASTLMTIKLT